MENNLSLYFLSTQGLISGLSIDHAIGLIGSKQKEKRKCTYGERYLPLL